MESILFLSLDVLFSFKQVLHLVIHVPSKDQLLSRTYYFSKKYCIFGICKKYVCNGMTMYLEISCHCNFKTIARPLY